MRISTPATTAIFIAFTTLFSSVQANCVERPKSILLNKFTFGGIFKSTKWCKPGEKPTPPFDFKKWSATRTGNRPTGVSGYVRPTGSAGVFWYNRFGATGTAGTGRPNPTAGVFWHKPGQTGTAVSRVPRPTITIHKKIRSTTIVTATATNKKPFQTTGPRAVEWTG